MLTPSAGGNIPALPLIKDYTNSIATLLTFTSMSGTGTSDAQLSNDVITLTALARAEDQASEQRGTLYAALLARQFPPQGLATMQSAQAQQAAAQQDFQSSGSLAEQQLFQDTMEAAARSTRRRSRSRWPSRPATTGASASARCRRGSTPRPSGTAT